ncbi:hypothetical protein [Paraflavitalea speifideaquila]|uniref:hypothetical protein n=1 Tax=Paraflavitalea speifideaquila TaxID=3076558 RepID=UPI0028E8F4A9|nr:hypothetical protein [Paraflavitalea speifideiaquila]
MKPKRLFKLTVAVICALVVGTSFLTPERAPKKQGSGEFVIEYKGKKYVATERNGTATIGADKKAFVFIVGDCMEGKKSFRLQFNFYPMPNAFKLGKYELTTCENHTDRHLKDGCVIVSYGTLADNDNEAPPQLPGDLAGVSETGSVTFTTIKTNQPDKTALITGSFEFTGKNDVDYSTEKTFSIKGTFKNLEVTYADLSGPIR